jgi:hypothetical protein
MAKNILKEAIADAKAVREVALANAKAALEEAFTPRLQSMLSAKLSETLNEEEEDLDENKEEIDEMYEDDPRADKEMDETYMEGGEDNLDEEIDLEEILNELELEEGDNSKEETVDEAKKDNDYKVEEVKNNDEDTVDEGMFDFLKKKKAAAPKSGGADTNPIIGVDYDGNYIRKDGTMAESKDEDKIDEMQVNYSAETANRVGYQADYVHEGTEKFDLDALLEEINNLDETEEDEVNEGGFGETNEVIGAAIAGIMIGALPLMAVQGALADKSPEELADWKGRHPNLSKLMDVLGATAQGIKQGRDNFQESAAEGNTYQEGSGEEVASPEEMAKAESDLAKTMGENTYQEEIHELESALKVKTTELNEVNLLNSKLLYVNRIFKANNLNEGQKLRVVETLDNASNIKEAKLIYETIKDTFTVAKSTKTTPKKSIKESLGMASKPSGTTQSVARNKPVLNESNDMVSRMQKLANITIKQ